LYVTWIRLCRTRRPTYPQAAATKPGVETAIQRERYAEEIEQDRNFEEVAEVVRGLRVSSCPARCARGRERLRRDAARAHLAEAVHVELHPDERRAAPRARRRASRSGRVMTHRFL
jgi:hypothetical protein